MTPQNSQVSEGTIIKLKELLEQAESGHVIGLAFVGVTRGRRPTFGWTGLAGQDPLFTVGAIQRLNQALVEHAKSRGY